jgi:hypothetical protein
VASANPSTERLRQKLKFKPSLGYLVRPCLKKQIKTDKKIITSVKAFSFILPAFFFFFGRTGMEPLPQFLLGIQHIT